MLSLNLIPLKQLHSSELNVRKSNIDEDIKALADDIAAHGLKQNLVVVPHATKAGRFEVVAGGRRLQALNHLADEGVISLDEKIPALLEERAEGRATSLSENLHRIAMNPADEVTAYATIVAEHPAEPDPVAYCAKRFGVTRHHVEQRLRLADLAPDILEALRTGAIGVDSAKAYGSFADHALQFAVFRVEEKRTYGTKHSPAAIRDAMKSKTYPSGIAQAIYVGLDAYHAGGGRSERELFMGADEGERLTDPTLLDKLAREKAAAELPALVKRDGFFSGLLTQGFGPHPAWPKEPAGFGRAHGMTRADMPKKQRGAAIGVYALKIDGSGIDCVGILRKSETGKSASGGHSYSETPTERSIRQRREAIALRAAQLAAVPSFEGTPFAGKAFWPDAGAWVRPVEQKGGARYVCVLVRVTDEEIEAHHAEAEAALDAEEATAEAAKLAAAAATPAEPQAEQVA